MADEQSIIDEQTSHYGDAADQAKHDSDIRRVCKSWEAAVCDISTMASIAADYIGDSFGEEHKQITGRKNFYFFSSQQIDRMTFTVVHLEQMIAKFREDYYTAIERH